MGLGGGVVLGGAVVGGADEGGGIELGPEEAVEVGLDRKVGGEIESAGGPGEDDDDDDDDEDDESLGEGTEVAVGVVR